MNTIDGNNFNAIINDEKLSIIDFYATWCMPCRILSPILDQVAENMSSVNFYKLDIDEYEDIAKRFRVFSVPTLMAFKQGKLLDSLVGLNNYEDIVNFVKRCDSIDVKD